MPIYGIQSVHRDKASGAMVCSDVLWVTASSIGLHVASILSEYEPDHPLASAVAIQTYWPDGPRRWPIQAHDRVIRELRELKERVRP